MAISPSPGTTAHMAEQRGAPAVNDLAIPAAGQWDGSPQHTGHAKDWCNHQQLAWKSEVPNHWQVATLAASHLHWQPR